MSEQRFTIEQRVEAFESTLGQFRAGQLAHGSLTREQLEVWIQNIRSGYRRQLEILGPNGERRERMEAGPLNPEVADVVAFAEFLAERQDAGERFLRIAQWTIPRPDASDVDVESLGRLAYETYSNSCGGVSVRGDSLPSWDGQESQIKGHWELAAQAVGDRVARALRSGRAWGRDGQ